MIKKLLFLLFLFTSLHALAQDADFFKPDSVRKQLKAVKITTSINVDGLLNEPEWKLAALSSTFIQIEP